MAIPWCVQRECPAIRLSQNSTPIGNETVTMMTHQPPTRHPGRWTRAVAAPAAALWLLTGCASPTTPSTPATSSPVPTSETLAGSGSGTPQPHTSAATTPAHPTPTPTVPGKVLQVGLDVNEQSIDVNLGERLIVALGPDWTAPTIQPVDPNNAPLITESATVIPTAPTATSTFLAVHTGTTTITATTDYTCLHTAPACMLVQQQFTLTVRVVPPAVASTPQS